MEKVSHLIKAKKVFYRLRLKILILPMLSCIFHKSLHTVDYNFTKDLSSFIPCINVFLVFNNSDKKLLISICWNCFEIKLFCKTLNMIRKHNLYRICENTSTCVHFRNFRLWMCNEIKRTIIVRNEMHSVYVASV